MISSENKRLSDLEYGKLNRYYNQKLQEWVEDTNMVNGSMQITFYDRIGRLDATKTSEVTDNQLSEKMNMQLLADGMYMIVLTDKAGKSMTLKCKELKKSEWLYIICRAFYGYHLYMPLGYENKWLKYFV